MRYDDKVTELLYTTVSDGFTDYTDWIESGVIIDALVAPVSADVQLRSYGFVSNKVAKVFTKAEINDKNRYKINGVTYVVRQLKQHKHGRNFMLLDRAVMSRYVQGIDDMIKYIKRIEKEQEADVKKAIRQSAYLLEAQAKALAPVQSGYLRESIKTHIKDGGLSAEVISHAEYSLFVEYGTSKQEAQQYMSPAYFKAKEHFERLIERGNQ